MRRGGCGDSKIKPMKTQKLVQGNGHSVDSKSPGLKKISFIKENYDTRQICRNQMGQLTANAKEKRKNEWTLNRERIYLAPKMEVLL